MRGHAVAQLGAFRMSGFAPEVAASIQRIEARDKDAAVRWHAAWMLFRGFATLASPAFLEAQLRSTDAIVRVETLRAWGRRTDPAAAALVRPLLEDTSWRVQLEAAEALKRIAKQPPDRASHGSAAGPESAPVAPMPAATPRTLPVPTDKPVAPDPAVFPLGVPMLPERLQTSTARCRALIPAF